MAEYGYNGITSDISECEVGDTVHISKIYCSSASCSYYLITGDDFVIYEDGVQIDTINGRTFYEDGYDYVPTTNGTHTISFKQNGYDPPNTLTITVTAPILTGSWTIGNKTVQSLTINNKEVQSIERLSDNKIIYEKEEVVKVDLVLTVTGSSFSEYNNSSHITGNDMIVDYGDGTIEPLGTRLAHSYTDGIEKHNIKITGVTAIGNNCFKNCTNLTKVYIPNTVTTLSSSIFSGCTNLISVTLPNTISQLGNSLFYNCVNLTNITIPSSVNIIDGYCFSGTGLRSIVIPDTVTTLYSGCFSGCTNLISVVIPDTVTTLGSSIFSGCTALIEYQLYWKTSIPYQYTWSNSWMPNNADTYYTIPKGSSSIYIAKNFPSAKLVERSE